MFPSFVSLQTDMNMERLDARSRFPDGLQEYIEANGPHFNQKLCKWAVSKMIVKDDAGKEKKLEPWTQDEVDDMLKKYGVQVKNDRGYDVCYVANMLKADFFKKSLTDEAHLCQHIKLYQDDVDGDPCRAFDEFFATCIGKGVAIPWERML